MTYPNSPLWTVQVSFSPIFGAPTWVDISQYVQSFTTTMGKQHERNEVEASKATITLDNRAATFNPWNTASPYYGLGGVGLVPMLPIRITASWPPGGGTGNIVSDVTAAGGTVTLNTSSGATTPVVVTPDTAAGGTVTIGTGSNPDGMNMVSTARAAGGTLTLVLGTAGTTYPVFYGYVDSWVPSWHNPLSEDLTIEATDILGVLAQMDMNSTYYARTVLADSPMAWYRLGDAIAVASPGTGLIDSSGTGETTAVIHPGVVDPTGATGNTPVVFNGAGAFNLDATTSAGFSADDLVDGDYIQLTTTTSAPTSWSVECWMMGTGDTPLSGSTEAKFSLIDSPGNFFLGLSYFTYGGPTPSLQVIIDAKVGTAMAYLGNLADGNWHQVVLTTSATTQTLYVDGALVQTVSGGLPFPLTQPTPSRIGGCYNTNSILSMQDVSYYNYVLSAGQVAAHFAAGTITEMIEPSGIRLANLCRVKGIPSYSIAAGISEIQPTTSTLVGTKTLSYMQQVNDTESGLLFQTPNGVLTFYDRHYILTSPLANTSQATFEDAATSEFFYLIDTFTPGLDNLDLWNEVQVSAQATGASVNPSGALQLYEDVVSQAQYGQRTYPSLTGLLMTSDAEALELAQWVGTHYSNPMPRVRSIRMNNAPNGGVNLPQMLGRGMWDRITVIHHGLQGGTPFVQDSIIEGISHSVTPATWTTTFALSPAETQDYMILDSAEFGQLDSARLAY